MRLILVEPKNTFPRFTFTNSTRESCFEILEHLDVLFFLVLVMEHSKKYRCSIEKGKIGDCWGFHGCTFDNYEDFGLDANFCQFLSELISRVRCVGLLLFVTPPKSTYYPISTLVDCH